MTYLQLMFMETMNIRYTFRITDKTANLKKANTHTFNTD